MKIKTKYINGIKVIEIKSNDVLIRNVQDALDLMATASVYTSDKIIIHEKNIISDFFNLTTGIAGEILQKFSTYNLQIAIIGDYSKFTSKSLKDFIFESNKYGPIIFVNSIEEAYKKLTG